MDSNQYKYFAFISYKREDEKWAKWLQRKLESYNLPTAMRKENPELPSRIRPVFRDQSDLSVGNLKEEIEKGLNASKYLIVICSPRSAKSPWVSKEVQHFMNHGREDYIIPFIIGGTPNATSPEDECFPEGLRQLTGEKEILGVNINEMGRDAATIKVIARMLGLQFDSLWQRSRRIKRRNIIITSIFILLLLLLATCVAIVLWSNNKTINNQNEQLTNLVKSLEEENKTFSHLRNRIERYTYVGSLRGNDAQVIRVAYHPYEPIMVFSDEWGYWIHYIQSNLEICLPPSNDSYCVMMPQDLGFTRDGNKIAATSWGGLYIWDATTLKLTYHALDAMYETVEKMDLLQEDNLSYDISLDSLNVIFKNIFRIEENQIIVKRQEKTVTTTLPYQEPEDIFFDQNPNHINILYNKPFNEVLFIGEQRAALYDYDQNAFIQFFKGYSQYDFAFSSSGEYLRIDKDLFARNMLPDTISNLNYKINPKNFNQIKLNAEKQSPHNPHNMFIKENTIVYTYGNDVKQIEVFRNNAMGNGQEYLVDAFFLEPNKIVAIIAQGKHRIYNAQTGSLIGAVPSYIWQMDYPSMGLEGALCHADSHIISYKIVNRDLYVVSSGAM